MNIVGPLANPARAGRQVVGVADARRVPLIAGALRDARHRSTRWSCTASRGWTRSRRSARRTWWRSAMARSDDVDDRSGALRLRARRSRRTSCAAAPPAENAAAVLRACCAEKATAPRRRGGGGAERRGGALRGAWRAPTEFGDARRPPRAQRARGRRRRCAALETAAARRADASREDCRLVPPQHPDDDPLDRDVVLVHVDRRHRLVRRLQADAAVALAVELLHRGRVAVRASR